MSSLIRGEAENGGVIATSGAVLIGALREPSKVIREHALVHDQALNNRSP